MAHTYIAHIWEYSPPPPPGGTKSESFKMLSAERLVRSARFWSCFSLSLLIVRAKSTAMEVNRDFTSKVRWRWNAAPLFSFLMLSRSFSTLVVGFNLLSVKFKYVWFQCRLIREYTELLHSRI